VHLHLVDQPVGQELLDDAGAPADPDGTVAGCVPGQRERGVEPPLTKV
jgi:hypothetical protein